MEDDQQDESKDMDLGKLAIDAIKKELNKKGKKFVPSIQIYLLQETILKTMASIQLGIEKYPQMGVRERN